MTGSDYLTTVADFYECVARTPDVGLCCVGGGQLTVPDLCVPPEMEAMSYGCGSSVQPGDLGRSQRIVYVGVGGGKEALQFAYFSRMAGGVVAIDPVAAMREAALKNLVAAAACNPWFDPAYVDVRAGDAFALGVDDASVDIVAQNCLFNVFEPDDLARALEEARRVLRPGGRLSMSDPIASRPIPAHLRGDARLRAMCLSGALTDAAYVARIVDAGFGAIEVRRRRPYRVLDAATYGLDAPLLLESIDLVARAIPIPADGPCVFTGRTATYVGSAARFDDGTGHVLERGVPLDVCDKTATKLGSNPEVMTTASTWHYAGGGVC
ncbi:MAG: arsenosugar biosynthesis arsenite methyltransferase ArsM [Vulcanimicrobiaceae bacterium]